MEEMIDVVSAEARGCLHEDASGVAVFAFGGQSVGGRIVFDAGADLEVAFAQ